MNANIIITAVFDKPNLSANVLIKEDIGLKLINSYTKREYFIL